MSPLIKGYVRDLVVALRRQAEVALGPSPQSIAAFERVLCVTSLLHAHDDRLSLDRSSFAVPTVHAARTAHQARLAHGAHLAQPAFAAHTARTTGTLNAHPVFSGLGLGLGFAAQTTGAPFSVCVRPIDVDRVAIDALAHRLLLRQHSADDDSVSGSSSGAHEVKRRIVALITKVIHPPR